MKKKLLGILLTIGLVLTMIPATVFAEGKTYTLEWSEAKAVYGLGGESTKDATIQSWFTIGAGMLLTKPEAFESKSWSEYYTILELTMGPDLKFSESNGSFTKNDDLLDFTLLCVLTDETMLKPGASYKIYVATVDDDVLTIDPTPIASGKLPTDIKETNETSDTATAAGDVTKDVTVDYTYLPESNTAEKVFNVTIDYTFPATLDAKAAQNVYTWSPTDGKYTKDTTNSTDASYVLSDDGAFEITVTNKSNVDISYEVSYAANTSAVFASALNGSMTNDKATLATVAQGQEVTTDGINITDDTAATTAMSGEFNSETCSGTLEVTGINSTPDASGEDTLGTLIVNISEHVEVETKTLGEFVVGTKIPTAYNESSPDPRGMSDSPALAYFWINGDALEIVSVAEGHEGEKYSFSLSTTMYYDSNSDVYTSNLNYVDPWLAYDTNRHKLTYNNIDQGIEENHIFTVMPD